MDPKLARCHLLAEVLSADGIMHESERMVLEGAMEKLGLDQASRAQVRDFIGNEGAAEALRGLPEEVRRGVVDDLLAAVLIDGRLSPLETEAVGRIREALGLD
jgi:uncharacterized tellurite resistance protein B-like protein